MDVQLIDETDGAGGVLWLWTKQPGQAQAQPVRPAAIARRLLPRDARHGAARAAMPRPEGR